MAPDAADRRRYAEQETAARGANSLFPTDSTVSMPGLKASGSVFLAVDHLLLENGQQIIDKPVKNQAGSKINKHKGKNHRQKHHDLGLGGIGRGRSHLLLEEHGGPHEQGQDRNSAQIGDIKADP